MESARIVLFGDTHLGFDLPVKPRVQRRRRGEDFFANYKRVLAHIIHTRPDAAVHVGDFFHRSRVAPAVADRAFSALLAVAERGIPVLIVPGNHDRSRLPTSLWLAHRNVHVFDRPRTIVVESAGMRLAFGGFPFAWGDLGECFARQFALAALDEAPADARFLCIHHTVAGASVGPHGYTFRAGPDVIPAGQLPHSLTAVLAGHIHRSQVLHSGPHPPVFYPGSTERTSFAEADETKGFFDLTVARGSGGSVTVAAAEFVRLPARPMVDLIVRPTLEAADVPAFLKARAAQYAPDAIVRITAEALRPEVVDQLRSERLRAAFPATMNVQLGRGLFDAFE